MDGKNSILTELENEKNKLRDVKEAPHNFYYEAPTLFILSADKNFSWSEVDSGIAVENMAIAAESLGLGSLIIGCIKDAMRGENEKYYSEKFKIPEGYEYKIAIAVGYKAMTKVPHEYDINKSVSYID